MTVKFQEVVEAISIMEAMVLYLEVGTCPRGHKTSLRGHETVN